jgi:hypothetical protein
VISSAPYAKLVAETQQQAVKTVESGFEFAARLLDLQKKYVLGVAGLLTAASPTAKD